MTEPTILLMDIISFVKQKELVGLKSIILESSSSRCISALEVTDHVIQWQALENFSLDIQDRIQSAITFLPPQIKSKILHSLSYRL